MVAVAQVAHELEVDDSGFVKFAALFVPVWWAWVGFTFYSDRFDTDDLVFRLLMIAEMLGVAALASTTPDLTPRRLHGLRAFLRRRPCGVDCSVSPRLPARSAGPRSDRPLLRGVHNQRRTLAGLAPLPHTGAVLGVGDRNDHRPGHAARGAAIHPGGAGLHDAYPERIGLFTIIVLGESVFAVVVGTSDTDWNAHALVAAVGGFAVAAAFWWIYFDTLDMSLFEQGLLVGQIYSTSALLRLRAHRGRRRSRAGHP